MLEKMIILIVGAAIMYYTTSMLMDKFLDEEILTETYIKPINQYLPLNKYEISILDDVVDTNDILETFDDIIGHEDTKEDMKTVIVEPLNEKVDIDLPNGVIFYGPPGTGKSMFARCIAKETNSTFINFSLANVENKMYGESTKYLKAVFTLADKLSPCIIFIDELDGFGSCRNSMDQHHINSLKTQFLTHVDGLIKKSSKIICIGATNRIDIIDRAVKRRMRKHILLSPPSNDEIKILFNKHLGDLGCNITDEMIEQCEGLSGSDIYELSKNIKLHCIKNKNFEEVFQKQSLCFTDETCSQ